MTLVTTDVPGLFKEVYANDIINIVPNGAVGTRMFPFEKAQASYGAKYVQPFIISDEQGFTYATAGSGAFAINTDVPMTTVKAEVEGTQILLQYAIDYETAARSQGDRNAFKSATKMQVANAMNSFTRRLENLIHYGGTHSRSGLGIVEAVTPATATTATIRISLASWSARIWSGLKNVRVDAYTPSGGVPATKANVVADLVVTSIDIANRSILITGNSADISALAAAQFILYKGSFGNEFIGLAGILPVTSGTLFNVNVATTETFQGNTYDCAGGPLNLPKILAAMDIPASRGLDSDRRVTILCNPKVMRGLVSDEAALRRYGGSEKVAANGFRSVEFYSPNGGLVEIKPDGWVKEGDAFMIPEDSFVRGGASDITMTPGDMGSASRTEMVFQLTTQAGWASRLYANQFLFPKEGPAQCLLFSNIVNPT